MRLGAALMRRECRREDMPLAHDCGHKFVSVVRYIGHLHVLILPRMLPPPFSALASMYKSTSLKDPRWLFDQLCVSGRF